MYSFHCFIWNIFFPFLELPFTADCFYFKLVLNCCTALLLGHDQNASAGMIKMLQRALLRRDQKEPKFRTKEEEDEEKKTIRTAIIALAFS